MIYEFCLCVEGYIVPFKESIHTWHAGDTEEKPTVTVLAINKQIRNEALPVVYGKNKWRISSDADYVEDPVTIWSEYCTYFRHVVVYCDQLDFDPGWLEEASKKARQLPNSDQWQRMQYVHNYAFESLTFNVGGKVLTAMNMIHLSSFVINVEKFYCPQGCCRILGLREMVGGMVEWWTDIQTLDEDWKPDWKITFTGIGDREEEAVLYGLTLAKPPIPWELDVEKWNTDHDENEDSE